MTLGYGYIKGKVVSGVRLQGKPVKREVQYHEHFFLGVAGSRWDVAVNVGTNDADDLLRFKLVFDFHHPVTANLAAGPSQQVDLTDADALPALDFERSDILAETGDWRDSDPMDGGEATEPAASLKRLLDQARAARWDTYAFGRFYTHGGDGIHDIHMNQGSSAPFIHQAGNDNNDHNDVWQDGAVLVDRGAQGWAGYFARFTKQKTPTDDLGNPM